MPGAAAAVVSRVRGVVYEGAVGLARSSDGLPMRADTPCRIASMTKLVTTIVVLMLVEEGKVELDAPFISYFKEYRQPDVLTAFDVRTHAFTTEPAVRAVTVRDLLTHTSGYGYWFLHDGLCALTPGAPENFNPPFLVAQPGTRFAYGISTDVLGQLIEPVTGVPLERAFAERVFAPLGMSDTGWSLPAPERLAAVHVPAGDGWSEQPLERRAEAPRGGGALYSTASDYARLLALLVNGGVLDGHRLLAPESVVALATNQIGALAAPRQRSAAPARTADFGFMDGSQKFGFGVLIETRARPNGRAAGSYGWAGIFNTYFWVDPAAGLACTVFMQSSPFSSEPCLAVCDAFERAVYSLVSMNQ